MIKKVVTTVLGLVILLGAIVGIKALQIVAMVAQGKNFVPPPEAISTAVATEEHWAPVLTAIGSLSAVQGLTVSAELEAKIVQIGFEAGTSVKRGDLLVKQDVSAEEAQLRSAEAGVTLAKLNLERSKQLLSQSTISQSQLDADNAAYQQAMALADNLRATIAKKTIRAPFAGRLGVRLVNLGQMLKAGDPIVSLQALDPIFVDFYLPQDELAQLKSGLKVALGGDALGGTAAEGVITAISPDVDAATRNVRVQATVRNEHERLHPGMFVDVSVELPAVAAVVVIPATAIVYAPYGDTIFIVEDKKDPKTGNSSKVVRQQVVRLGDARGDFVAVISGLKAGEVVATSGVFKLREGMPVSINNSVAPDAQIAPKPSDS